MTRKTHPGPAVARMSPASAGATRMLVLSFQPDTTFDAVSSSGVRQRPGVSAAIVGRVIVVAVAATAAQAYARAAGPSRSSTAAVAPMAVAWMP